MADNHFCTSGLYSLSRNQSPKSAVFQSPEGGVYLNRYEDCLRLLTDSFFSRTAPGSALPFSGTEQRPGVLESMISEWMVFMDPPDHTRVRKAFSAAFNPRAIKPLEPFVREQVAHLLGRWPAGGRHEIVNDFAFALPVQVISILLGVPLQDVPRIHAWAMGLTTALDSGSPEALNAGESVAHELTDYFKALIVQRDRLPADCLINTLASTTAETLSEDEFLYGCMFLLWAGHETTKNWIASGMLLLAQHPQQLARLQAQPDLLNSALEEMLRMESPLQKLSRWSTKDSEFAGVKVPAGTLITALIGEAHRDPAVFANPDTFDIARCKNPHIAFGAGIHHCLGIWLARLETRVVFSELLPRIRELEVINYRWRDISAFRSLESLEMKVMLKC
jgi:cytochrome P450